MCLGDTGTDMHAAAAAGMFPGVLCGFRTPEDLEANGAGAIINKPGELLELLGC